MDVNANVAVFFKNGTYDQDVLWYTEDVKQPTGLAELVSVGSELILPQKAPGFTKPVMVSSFPIFFQTSLHHLTLHLCHKQNKDTPMYCTVEVANEDHHWKRS